MSKTINVGLEPMETQEIRASAASYFCNSMMHHDEEKSADFDSEQITQHSTDESEAPVASVTPSPCIPKIAEATPPSDDSTSEENASTDCLTAVKETEPADSMLATPAESVAVMTSSEAASACPAPESDADSDEDAQALDNEPESLSPVQNEEADDICLDAALTPEIAAIMERVARKGYFDAGQAVAPIAGTDDLVYAGIREDRDFNRWLTVVFRKTDGTFTHPLRLDFAMLQIAASFDFKVPKGHPLYSELKKFHIGAIKGIINRLPLCCSLDYLQILRVLVNGCGSLPVFKEVAPNADIIAIYRAVVEYAYAKQDFYDYIITDKYFRLVDWDLEGISVNLDDLPTKEILEALKDNHLLHVTGDRPKYKARSKYGGKPEWFYTVVRLAPPEAKPANSAEPDEKALPDPNGTGPTPLSNFGEIFGLPKAAKSTKKSFPDLGSLI